MARVQRSLHRRMHAQLRQLLKRKTKQRQFRPAREFRKIERKHKMLDADTEHTTPQRAPESEAGIDRDQQCGALTRRRKTVRKVAAGVMRLGR